MTSIEDLESTALGVLGQLCERYQELSLESHIAVMEAFNTTSERVGDLLPEALGVDQPVGDLIDLAVRVLDELASRATATDVHLCYATAVALVEAARPS